MANSFPLLPRPSWARNLRWRVSALGDVCVAPFWSIFAFCSGHRLSSVAHKKQNGGSGCHIPMGQEEGANAPEKRDNRFWAARLMFAPPGPEAIGHHEFGQQNRKNNASQRALGHCCPCSLAIQTSFCQNLEKSSSKMEIMLFCFQLN